MADPVEISHSDMMATLPEVKQPSLVDRIKSYMNPPKAKPTPGEISHDKLMQQVEIDEPRATFGLYPKQPVRQTKLQAKPGEVEYGPGKALGIVAGSVGAFTDMFLPGIISGIAAPGNAALYGLSRLLGNPESIAKETGNQWTQELLDWVPKPLLNSWGQVASNLGSKALQAYEDNPVAFMGHLISGGLEKSTENLQKKTGVDAHILQQTATAIFGTLMGKATGSAFSKSWEGMNERAKVKFINDLRERNQTRPEAEPVAPPAPVEPPAPEVVAEPELVPPEPKKFKPAGQSKYNHGPAWREPTSPMFEDGSLQIVQNPAQVKALFDNVKKEAKAKGNQPLASALESPTVDEVFTRALENRPSPRQQDPFQLSVDKPWIMYHGSADRIRKFDPGITWITPDRQYAREFAYGADGSQGRITLVQATPGKTKTVESSGIQYPTARIQELADSARSDGFRYIKFSDDGEVVSLYPHEDLHIRQKRGAVGPYQFGTLEGSPQYLTHRYAELSEQADGILQKPPAERNAQDNATLNLWQRMGKGGQFATVATGGLAAALLANDNDMETTLPMVTAMFLPAHPWQITKAKALQAAGKSRDAIWRAVPRVFQGADGFWRQERSDAKSALAPDLARNPYNPSLLASPGRLFKSDMPEMGSVLKHEDLYAEVPEAAKLKVGTTGLAFDTRGSFDPADNIIRLAGGRPQEVRSTALHELSHYMDEVNGWARGGNSGRFLTKKFKDDALQLRSALTQIVSDMGGELGERLNKFTLSSAVRMQKEKLPLFDHQKRELELAQKHPNFPIMKALLEEEALVDAAEAAAYQKYKRLLGEVQARLVEARKNLTEQELLEHPPWEKGKYGYDIPEDQFILSFKAGEALASKEKGGFRGEDGKADLRLVAGIAAIGGTALLGAAISDDTLQGAVRGAIVGTLLGTKGGRRVFTNPAWLLGSSSTRIINRNPRLGQQLINMDRGILKDLDRANDATHPFLLSISKLDKSKQDQVHHALLNDTPQLITSIPGMAKPYQDMMQLLKTYGAKTFPRVVDDVDGLIAAMPQGVQQLINTALTRARMDSIRKHSRDITELEKSAVINNELQGLPLPANITQFYKPAADSLQHFLTGKTLERYAEKMFGPYAVYNKGGHFNLKASIYKLVEKQVENGTLTDAQALDVRNIMRARLVEGEKAMPELLQDARNWSNAGLLGQLQSTVTQLQDPFMSIYHHGMVNTLIGAAKLMKPDITVKDLGLVNHVAEELSRQRLSGTVLQKALTMNGFKFIDIAFGKQLLLNASVVKNQQLAKSARGVQILRDRWEARLSPQDFAQFVTDLKSKQHTDLVEQVTFSELSKAQPISKMEMPEAYNAHPNGRILFQLRSFLLKQMDIAYRDVIQEFQKGHPITATKNAAALLTLYALLGVPVDMLKDWLSGREPDPFKFPKLVENVMQNFGLNRYNMDKLMQGNITDVISNTVMPPIVRMGETAWKDAEKAVSYIPPIGKVIYDRALGGNERAEIAETQSENRGKPKGARKPLSPAAKAYRKEQREQRKRQLEPR